MAKDNNNRNRDREQDSELSSRRDRDLANQQGTTQTGAQMPVVKTSMRKTTSTPMTCAVPAIAAAATAKGKANGSQQQKQCSIW
ncbi:hypothetical protein HRG84_06990 [Flavisolibacter sp. BT320]|nr:hypothetical protein [Flavisolibacter longurius]